VIQQQRTHPDSASQAVLIVGLNRQNLHSDTKMQESMVSPGVNVMITNLGHFCA
jgi:hypothetical protein